jgi:hypothetical protein
MALDRNVNVHNVLRLSSLEAENLKFAMPSKRSSLVHSGDEEIKVRNFCTACNVVNKPSGAKKMQHVQQLRTTHPVQ